MSYVKVNVLKPGDNKGSGGDKLDHITIFDWDDVLVNPARDSKGVVITGNFQMNPNAYMITLYSTQDKTKANVDSEGDPDAKGFTHTVEVSHPGNEVAIREFRSYWVNRNVSIIIERCSSTTKTLYGTKCAPLQMVIKAEDDKDKTLTTFTFKSTQKSGLDCADYQGTMTMETVTGTVAADDASPDVTQGEGQYQLTTGTAAPVIITTLDNAIDGGSYTLLGSGGAHPSTVGIANDFILASGIGWTALAGAQLTVKAYKSGAATWKFFELSRS
jgi:hypothetical protein